MSVESGSVLSSVCVSESTETDNGDMLVTSKRRS